MKELVEVIAKALVDDPDSVAVSERQDGRTTVIEVRVADSDMGKVIGKQGRIAKAIRSVVKAAAAKEDKKVVVDIIQELDKKGTGFGSKQLPPFFFAERIGEEHGTVFTGRCDLIHTWNPRGSQSISDHG